MRTGLSGCLNTFGIEEMHHTHVPVASHVITGMLFTAPNERGKKENKVGGKWSTAKASRGYELELPRCINRQITPRCASAKQIEDSAYTIFPGS